MIQKTSHDRDDRAFPPALADVARTEFPYDDGDGIDFEPYDAFVTAEETTDWLRHWTRNHELDGEAYRLFGQDGTGGLAAVWFGRPGRPLADQPVVFMGSEGENGVVAGNLSDFLWVLADGCGPFEAVVFEDDRSRPHAALTALAERHATTPRRPARAVIAEARAEFPTFAEDIEALCR
ncbi:SMI1/KNR4 family protein [Streptomyces sp. NPDC005925]|uniref:SMI1/KNR4 family protein n=1 Tax=Streptomyces sp. NPDC005925 TaxID=3157172 RepID=UPI0033C64038